MVTIKEQMAKARHLIKNKQYEEARQILREVDHPLAKDWLTKLEGMARQQPAPQKNTARKTRRPWLPVLAVMLGGVGLIAVVVFALSQNNDVADSAPSSTTTATTTADETSSRLPLLQFETLIYVDLPQDWRCDCQPDDNALVALDDSQHRLELTLLQDVFDPDAYQDVALADVITERIAADGEAILTQEPLQRDGRSVQALVVMDAAGVQQQRYYAKDSDGHPLLVSLAPDAPPSQALTDAALSIIARAEAQTGADVMAFSAQLADHAIAYNDAQDRWRVRLPQHFNVDVFVTLPPEWAFTHQGERFADVVNPAVPQAPSVQIALIEGDFSIQTDPLQDVAIFLSEREGRRLASIEALSLPAREAYRVISSDALTGNRTVTLYLRDSSDDLLALSMLLPDDEALQYVDTLQTMAATIEAQPIDYVARLARDGLLGDGIAMTSAGYKPLERP